MVDITPNNDDVFNQQMMTDMPLSQQQLLMGFFTYVDMVANPELINPCHELAIIILPDYRTGCSIAEKLITQIITDKFKKGLSSMSNN
jgi:hypothetical protein